MNVGIRLDKDDFQYDIHSLVKSFYPDDEVGIFVAGDEEKEKIPRDLLIEVSIPEYRREGESGDDALLRELPDRKSAKDALKRRLYSMLCEKNRTELPWGMLSGIRPTKIPMKLIREGKEDREILDHLRTYYCVSEERAALALQIAGTELRLLEGLDLGENSYSLYFHVPFCPSICLYCTFSSSPISVWEKRADEYVDVMIAEMKDRHEVLMKEGKNPGPTTVYIGGGTPTTLSAGQLDRLLSAIEETWDLSETVEFTVEAGRPDSFTKEKLEVLKAHGVTRISVNPQTMNQETLDVIGRRHTVEDTERAFRMAREAGFDNINMDIILGLPGEASAEVSETLRRITELQPESLTVHSLAVKRASRLRKIIREDREIDADSDRGNFGGLIFENSIGLMKLASDAAFSMKMIPYYLYRQKNMKGNLENTGFSKPGKECLYNILIMEEVQSIYAFGAGASTKYVYPGGRIERTVSPKDVRTWLERMQ